MTSGFPVQSGRQLGSPTLRHTDYCLHPVGRGFELPGVDRVRLRRSAPGRTCRATRRRPSNRRPARRYAASASSPHHGVPIRRRRPRPAAYRSPHAPQVSLAARILESQSISDWAMAGSVSPRIERLAATGTRRAQRHRTHPRGQCIQASIHAQRIQAGPSVEHGHGTILMASRSLLGTDRTHARFETGSGDDDHRLTSHITRTRPCVLLDKTTGTPRNNPASSAAVPAAPTRTTRIRSCPQPGHFQLMAAAPHQRHRGVEIPAVGR